jgi:hypothetical protein
VTLLQPATERGRLREARVIAVARGWEDALSGTPLAGRVVLPGDGPLRAVPDGNRSFVLPDVTVSVDGAPWYVSVKGVGAATPMYGDPAEPGPRAFRGERWFGEAPFGGQGEVNARAGLRITEAAAGRTSWNGFRLCPVLQVVEVPEDEAGRDRFWYRRHEGPVWQEHRLVPSDVRLFHAALHTLGQDPDRVLAAFGATDGRSLDAFLDALVRSGFAALTLYARTARAGPDGLRGLGYGHVWLDKDSVVAPDGSLCFADLEGLDEQLAGPERPFERIVTEQLEHNLYEVLFGVDTVQRAHERAVGRPLSDAARRRKVAARVALALDGDPFLRVEPRGDATWLWITCPARPAEPVGIRLFDGVR